MSPTGRQRMCLRKGSLNFSHNSQRCRCFLSEVNTKYYQKSVWSACYTRCPWSVPSSKTLFHSGSKFSPKHANSLEGVPSIKFAHLPS